MGRIIDEVKLWNTPLVGAFLLWRFTQGYCDAHPRGEAPVALLHFVATAVLTNHQMIEAISNQRRDLQSYIRGFEEKRCADILLGVQQNVKNKREYAMKAIDVAVSAGMLKWEVDEGRLYPCDLKKPGRGRTLKAALRRDGDKASILGKWFAAHDVPEIAAYMEIVF